MEFVNFVEKIYDDRLFYSTEILPIRAGSTLDFAFAS